jgi:hypothetical protein
VAQRVRPGGLNGMVERFVRHHCAKHQNQAEKNGRGAGSASVGSTVGTGRLNVQEAADAPFEGTFAKCETGKQALGRGRLQGRRLGRVEAEAGDGEQCAGYGGAVSEAGRVVIRSLFRGFLPETQPWTGGGGRLVSGGPPPVRRARDPVAEGEQGAPAGVGAVEVGGLVGEGGPPFFGAQGGEYAIRDENAGAKGADRMAKGGGAGNQPKSGARLRNALQGLGEGFHPEEIAGEAEEAREGERVARGGERHDHGGKHARMPITKMQVVGVFRTMVHPPSNRVEKGGKAGGQHDAGGDEDGQEDQTRGQLYAGVWGEAQEAGVQ